MSIDTSIPPPPPLPTEPPPPRSSATSRLVALIGLLGVAFVVVSAARLGYLALTDAWIAPLHLSPENDKVVSLRVQRSKERAERTRLETELHVMEEEARTLDWSLERLEALAATRRQALQWSKGSVQAEAQALREQARTLSHQKQLLAAMLKQQNELAQRLERDLLAGMVTATELQRETTAAYSIDVALHANDVQLSKVRAGLSEVQRRAAALATASSARVVGERANAMSPEIAEFDDDLIRIELEIARLKSEKRNAHARERAARDAIESMDALLRELEARPLYRAMSADTDVAFVPYEHLRRVAARDRVYACLWSIFDCREVGAVAEIVPGEVITQDPWGDLGRGQYVVLTLTDRSALYSKTLRVRRSSQSTSTGSQGR